MNSREFQEHFFKYDSFYLATDILEEGGRRLLYYLLYSESCLEIFNESLEKSYEMFSRSNVAWHYLCKHEMCKGNILGKLQERVISTYIALPLWRSGQDARLIIRTARRGFSPSQGMEFCPHYNLRI